MDLKKLTTGDMVLAGSGILLFIFSFFTWFKFESSAFGQTFGVNQNGWHFFLTGIVPALIALALIAYVVLTKLVDGVDLPKVSVGYPLVVLGLAALAAVLVVLRLLIGGDDNGTDVLDRAFGMYLATLAALALAAGGFLKFQEEGGELPNKKGGTGTRSGSTGDDSGGAPTPF